MSRAALRAAVAFAALLGAGLSAAGPALADSARIREAERSGEVAPLAALFDLVRSRFKGRILKVELEYEDEEGGAPLGWIYELKVLQSTGEVVRIEFDAKTLDILGINGIPYGQTDGED